MKMFSFLNLPPSSVISCLESACYSSRKTEVQQELDSVAAILQTIDIAQKTKELRSSSLLLLKSRIAKRYKDCRRQKFTLRNIKSRTVDFLREYPESPDREQAMYLMIRSRYLYARNSFSSLQAERYQKVLESYDLFMRLYAASSYRQEVEKLVEEAKEHIYSIE